MSTPLNIPDIPATVSVTNQLSRVLKVNGLPDIPANGTVTIDLLGQQKNFLKEARRVRRWKTIVSLVNAGTLVINGGSPLYGTVRVKNLSGVVLPFGGLMAALAIGEVRDVAMVNIMISRRVRLWKALQAAAAASHILIELTPSTDNPTVSSITPATSDLAGIAVTIKGEDFAPGATVAIGGVSCTSVVWVDDSTITCVAPVGTAGAKNVVVTNSGGHTGTLTNGFTYTAATFVSITPATGAAAGGDAVTIVGTNFKPGATVSIGGVPCTGVVVVDAAHITAVTGAHAAGAVAVVITNPGTGGSVATGAGAYTYA